MVSLKLHALLLLLLLSTLKGRHRRQGVDIR